MAPVCGGWAGCACPLDQVEVLTVQVCVPPHILVARVPVVTLLKSVFTPRGILCDCSGVLVIAFSIKENIVT